MPGCDTGVPWWISCQPPRKQNLVKRRHVPSPPAEVRCIQRKKDDGRHTHSDIGGGARRTTKNNKSCGDRVVAGRLTKSRLQITCALGIWEAFEKNRGCYRGGLVSSSSETLASNSLSSSSSLPPLVWLSHSSLTALSFRRSLSSNCILSAASCSTC
jgi:hypothetical protein